MNLTQLIALTPLLLIAATVVLVMAGIAIKRQHALAFGLSLAGLAATLVSLPLSFNLSPIQVTPLFVIDGYALFFIGLISAAALLTTLLSYPYLTRADVRREEYYLLLLITTLGASALAASAHLASFFLSLETTSVGLYALIAYRRHAQSPIEAAIKYLVLAGVSTALLTFGLALFYAATGALSFNEIGALSGDLNNTNLVMISAYLLVATGVAFKLSLAPFHLWTPDVYQGAPTPVTGYLATVSKGAVFAVLLRLMAETQGYAHPQLLITLTVIAVSSMLIGNWMALLQNNIKRLLAYSSIAHLGYLMVPLIAGGNLGTEAVMFYFAAYFVTTLGAFAVIVVLEQEPTGPQALADYRGLFWRRPWLAGVFSLMLLSLAGIPLTAGFPAKFYALAAGVEASLWVLTLALVAGSAIGLFYYLRIIITMASSTQTPNSEHTERRAADSPASPSPGVATKISLALLTGLLILFGVYPSPVITLIQQALG